MPMCDQRHGFTPIETLVFVAIVVVLGAVVFVTVDPLSRFRTARDSRRSADINAVLSAIKASQIESGFLLPAVSKLVAGSVYMIGTGSAGCDDQNVVCDTAVTSDASCIDLSSLVSGGLLGSVPVSPDGSGNWTAAVTGYTLSRSADGTLTVRACESENASEISASR